MFRKRAFIALLAVAQCVVAFSAINRNAVVSRNNPHVTEINPLHSLTIGNGRFAFTADATGLQTFPEYYYDGLSLCTFSEWGWHSFPNEENYKIEETLQTHPLQGQKDGVYAVMFSDGPERRNDASEWYRANPHRLHLGVIGFDAMAVEEISEIDQTLDLWSGELRSNFVWKKFPVSVVTSCHGERDIISASISSKAHPAVVLRFPYPTGEAADGAACWTADDKHSTEIVLEDKNRAVLRRTVDSTIYYVELTWSGKARLTQDGFNIVKITPASDDWNINVGYYQQYPVDEQPDYATCRKASNDCWADYWNTTGIIDFSDCTDERAPRLERRVILSQYLLRCQEAQSYPPAETGLTYNTWYGKFHLEMLMWHSFQYALWNKSDLLEKQLRWFKSAMPMARKIAQRQGFPGVRWMKMTDPSSQEAPSNVGSFIIWQQPHVIFMAELIYRAHPSKEFLEEYADMVEQTAKFMASFLNYDSDNDRYIIKGACAAAEAYNEKSTINPSFELAYWHFGLTLAQKWRERLGRERNLEWDEMLAKISKLATSPDGIYLPAEKSSAIPDFVNHIPPEKVAPMPAGGYLNGVRPESVAADTVAVDSILNPKDDPFYVKGTSPEHLLAYGVLPNSRVIDIDTMLKTLQRANENWDWEHASSGWNFPSLAMNATRLMQPDIAVRAITVNNREDMFLPSGNNYRSTRLRSYLPSNGGLLLAVSMMCAGWDYCTVTNPGFPKDGKWNVHWEGLSPMP